MKVAVLIDNPNKYFTGIGYSYERAFRLLGYETKAFNFDVDLKLLRFINKIDSVLEWYILKNSKKIKDEINSFQPDLIMVVKGYFLHPRTLNYFKSIESKPTLICFHPDDPQSKNIGASHQFVRDSIPVYDHYFIWSKTLVNDLKSINVNTHYLSFAGDPFLVKTDKNEKNMLYDISFIGNSDKERKRWMDELVSIFKDEKLDLGLRIFGSGWSKYNSKMVGSPQRGTDYFDVFRKSKINLNILRVQNKDATNMRTFEIPATGGFMLHEDSQEAKEFFKPGVEAEYFNSKEELVSKIRFYLKHEEARKKIATAGQKRAGQVSYSYSGRVKGIFDSIK